MQCLQNGLMLVLNPFFCIIIILLEKNHILLWVSTIRRAEFSKFDVIKILITKYIAAFILPMLLIHINQLGKKCWAR